MRSRCLQTLLQIHEHHSMLLVCPFLWQCYNEQVTILLFFFGIFGPNSAKSDGLKYHQQDHKTGTIKYNSKYNSSSFSRTTFKLERFALFENELSRMVHTGTGSDFGTQ
jgi:hypothetical protein